MVSAAKKQPNQIDVEVGARIRIERRLKGMSQTALGVAIGVTFQQVQKYELGVNRVSASRLAQLSGILSVPVSHFFPTSPEEAGTPTVKLPPVTSDEILKFLATEEGRALNGAFAKISEITIRRKVVGLVKALSDPPSETESAGS